MGQEVGVVVDTHQLLVAAAQLARAAQGQSGQHQLPGIEALCTAVNATFLVRDLGCFSSG